MGIFDRLERGIERAVKQPFARVFKAEVQPVEIASAMRDAMDDRAAVLGPGRTMVPNVFTIQLAESDHERLSSYAHSLTDELVAAAEDHADAQRYVAPGPFEVRLDSGDDLETGIFRVRAAAKDGRGNRGGSGPSARDYANATPREEALRADRDQQELARQEQARLARLRQGQQDGGDHGDDYEDDPHAAYRRPTGPARDQGHTRTFPEQSSRPVRDRGPRPVLEVDGRVRPLTAAVTVLGRDASADIVVDDPGVSRRHAELRISHDGPHLQVVLKDLDSTNGTYLNGEQVGTEELRNNDRITLGRSQLTFRLEG